MASRTGSCRTKWPTDLLIRMTSGGAKLLWGIASCISLRGCERPPAKALAPTLGATAAKSFHSTSPPAPSGASRRVQACRRQSIAGQGTGEGGGKAEGALVAAISQNTDPRPSSRLQHLALLQKPYSRTTCVSGASSGVSARSAGAGGGRRRREGREKRARHRDRAAGARGGARSSASFAAARRLRADAAHCP